MQAVCVFCGSNTGRGPSYVREAEVLGRLLATEGITLVYGGAGIGVMGALARAARRAGGRVVGVIPHHLTSAESAPEDLDELHRVSTMHERKALMNELADAFIALPGGLGTLEELAEIATWSQLGLHTKPVGLLNVDGFYDHLLTFLDHVVTERFLRAEHRELILTDQHAGDLLTALRKWQPQSVPKWPA